MKVFLSWSGDLSHRVALVLKAWLPNVIQQLDPFESSEDIEKGARWATELGRVLDECSYGIVCLTRTSLNSPWVNFESGALSKHVDNSRVSTFLLGLSPKDVSYPLAQFQHTDYAEADVKKLLESVNRHLPGGPISQSLLDNAFNMWWPELQKQLDPLAEEASQEDIERPHAVEATKEDTLEQILELVREQHRLVSSQVNRRHFLEEDRAALHNINTALSRLKEWTNFHSNGTSIGKAGIIRAIGDMDSYIGYLMVRTGAASIPLETRESGPNSEDMDYLTATPGEPEYEGAVIQEAENAVADDESPPF